MFRRKDKAPVCEHRWEEVGRTSVPPRRDVQASGWAAASDDFQKMAHGFTTVELKCTKCGDITAKTLIGRYS